MRLIDSNIIINATKTGKESLRHLVAEELPAVSVVTRVEVLGFHRITVEDREDLEAFFATIVVFPISDEVVERAIELRQARKMSLGDAFVATALVHRLELITRKVKDFAWIDGLIVIDPDEQPESME